MLVQQVVLTQSEDTQSDDDLFTGGDAGDQPVQNTVITHKCHHGLRKLRITGNIQRSAAVKHRQRLTEDTQGPRSQGSQRSQVSQVRDKSSAVESYQSEDSCSQLMEVRRDVPGRNRKFGTFGEPLR